MEKTIEYKGRTYTVSRYFDCGLDVVDIYLHRLPEERKHFWNFKKDKIKTFLCDFLEIPFADAIYKSIDGYWKDRAKAIAKEEDCRKFFFARAHISPKHRTIII